jgi:hypothetical protein
MKIIKALSIVAVTTLSLTDVSLSICAEHYRTGAYCLCSSVSVNEVVTYRKCASGDGV